ncbi:MAG: Asp-tRNA(Asn)/Glu-tRNA(Gln) amidotransferase subunit GatC [Deltaproteobacteria bacterium]|nr:Asp-tRNA(Asn)/Glu-tRNA(Gln) amidotransferase subunit GatC [Deltaproteobacteria bacterium]
MKLGLEEVRHVAKLARLHLSEAEERALGEQLSAILGHVAQLQALDVSNVPAMTHASQEPTRFREDEVVPGLGAEKAVANAPAHVGTAVAVPKIIE